MNKNLLDEIIGWYGAVAILLAYALISFGFLSVSHIIYQLLNLTGAAGFAYISYKKKAQQPAVLNVFWALVAIIAIIKLL